MLFVAQLALLTSCNTGKRNEAGVGIVGPAVGECTTGAAFLLSASTSTGCVGQAIVLDGLNFSSILANNRVLFTDNSGEFSIEGLVTQFIDNGTHPVFQCPSTSIVVRVPTGARTGNINLQVTDGNGKTTDAGLVSFTGCPEILGFAEGTAGNPFLSVDATFTFLTPDFQVYGHNLSTVTSVEITDPSGAAVTTATVTQNGVASPNYTLADGMDVVTVELSTATPIVPTCSAYYLRIRLVDASGGAPIISNGIIMPVREQFAPAEFEDLPGTIFGCIVPSGVRRGVVPLQFQLGMEPAQARYDVIPQFLDPITGTWFDCIGTPDTDTDRIMTGVIDMVGEFPSIVSGGASYTFHWDTVANGLVYDSTLDPSPITTRVRLLVDNPSPSVQTCDTFSQADARFESAPMLIDNPANVATFPPTLVGDEGSMREDWNDNLREDGTAGNTAQWNSSSPGELTGLPGTVLPWGTGTSDVVCGAVSIDSPGFAGLYQFNTNTGSITDVSDPNNPVLLHDPAGGDPVGVSVIRSLVIEQGAGIEIFGPNPLRIQISGDGNPDTLACQIHGSINLDGMPGTGAAIAVQGLGGVGGPGAGAGGDGGTIDVDTTGGGVVNFDVPATRGGNFGGYPGSNTTYAKIGEASSAKAGPGGGGGGLTAGDPGTTNFSANFDKAPPGSGGPARGDNRLLNLVAGSGGGGGGANVFRQTATANLRVDAGGGGGGGGGGFEVIVNGSVLISGTITANGGDGGAGATVHSGPGAGGSGGTVRFSATGNIGIADTALISCAGGQGSATTNQIGGDGAFGRVRLDASGTVNFPSQGDFTQVVPMPPSLTVTTGMSSAGAIQGGDGSDGQLDFGAFSPGLYVVDTDLGEISGPIAAPVANTAAAFLAEAALAPVIVTRTAAVAWNFSGLSIPAGVTLRGVGANPLIFRVTGECLIDGDGVNHTIDVSGFPGGLPDVLTDATLPTPGLGGAGGPGAGRGGDGGFANSPADFANAGEGSLSFLPPYMVAGPPLGGGGAGAAPLPPSTAMAAEGGVSASATGTANAGSGGGGAYGGVGTDAVGTLGGLGGSTYGSLYFTDPVVGGAFPYGGAGGGGGAGNVDVDPGEAFSHAPGTGGGGGGGLFQLAVVGNLIVTPASRITATGGRAFQAPIGAGNAGGGAGGGVQVQCQGIALFEGAVDVTGGLANEVPTGAAYVANGSTAGGNGGVGRARIETSLGFVDQADLQIVPDPSLGLYLGTLADVTKARSKPYLVASGGSSRRGESPMFNGTGTAQLSPPIPTGTASVVVYEGAKESVTAPGKPGPFEGAVSDPADLDNPDYIRATWYIFTNRATSQSIRLNSFELPYSF